VPWRDALQEVCQRTSGQPVDWWLTGSAALAVRGVLVEPGDLDLVCDAQGATILGDLFCDTLIEPVVPAGEEGSATGAAAPFAVPGSSGSATPGPSWMRRCRSTSGRWPPRGWRL